MTAFEQGLGRRSEEIVRTFAEQIRTGELAPGDRLPTEREMSDQLGASRSTIRRAMSRLSADGMVDVRRGVGIFVHAAPATPANTSRTISVMFSLDMALFAKIQQYALQHKYVLCPFPRREMGWDPAAERAFLEQVLHERHHALLAFCTPLEPRNDDLLKQIEDNGTRVLHVELSGEKPPRQNFLLPHYQEAGLLAAHTLHRARYTRLVFAQMIPSFPAANILWQGFQAGVKILKGKYNEKANLYGYPDTSLERPVKEAMVKEFLRTCTRPTGFLCPTLAMANDIAQYAQDIGLRVPEDIGVLSVPYLDYVAPAPKVDTIEFDRAKHLEKACAYVLDDAWGEIRDYVSPRVIRRGSVQHIKH